MSYWDVKKERDCITSLLGQTVTEITGGKKGDYEIVFKTAEETYLMYHEQDCCECVQIEDVIGDLTDLIGSPITMAEGVTREGEEDDWGTSTWTFYKLATNKGFVTIRWLGESNGYYSEEVDFARLIN